jgi:hypothetical protein
MAVEFRMPSMTGTDKEQLAQLKSYMFQFISELQFELNRIEAKIDATTKKE